MDEATIRCPTQPALLDAPRDLVGELPSAATVIRRGKKADVVRHVASAYELAGHHCRLDAEGDAVCDEKDESAPTIVIGYVEQGLNVGITFGTFRMPLATGGATCDQMSDLFDEARMMLNGLQVICENDMLHMGFILPIPENGITVRELNRSFRLVIHVLMVITPRMNERLRLHAPSA